MGGTAHPPGMDLRGPSTWRCGAVWCDLVRHSVVPREGGAGVSVPSREWGGGGIKCFVIREGALSFLVRDRKKRLLSRRKIFENR